MIRILHTSDLHASLESPEDRVLIVEAMLADAEVHANDRPIDLAVFSGDLADKGRPEEFDLGRELLLDKLTARLDVTPERIVIVPGNHDVNRDEIRGRFERALAETLTAHADVDELLADDRDLADALQRLAQWQEFRANSLVGAPADDEQPLAAARRLELGGAQLGIVTLNSAWRSSGKDDKGILLVGASEAERALDAVRDCAVKLVVMHHPLEWLHGFEADRLRSLFEVHNAIVLTGHEHDPDPHATKSPRGEAVYLQAGCLYESREYPNSYFVVDIDPEDRTVTVKIRRWSERTGVFDAATEIAKGGVAEFTLPGGGAAADLGHPLFSELMGRIARAAAELRVLPEDMSAYSVEPRSIEELLVRPRFLSVPYQEARAMATLDNGVEAHEVDPVLELADQPVIVVAGDPQGGVSSSLLWVLSGSYRVDASRMPAYFAAKDSKLGTAQQHGTLAKAASLFGHRQADSRDPDLLLAIDDVDPANERRLERIAAFIASNPRHRFVIGTRSNDASAVAGAIEKAGAHCVTVHLAPFRRSELRTLATTIRSGAGDVERIYGLIQTHNLPSTPFTMVALIAVLAAGEGVGTDLNQSSLLDAFVNVLLGGGEFADLEHLGMDYRKRVHMLGEFARVLYNSPEQVMPVPDAERMLLDYFERRDLPVSAGAVLQSVVDRHVLVIEDGQVGFRSEALYDLFLGRWMLESPEHKEEMLADPARNGAAITHAAGLDRSDRELLARVGEFSRGVIDAVALRLPRAEVDRLLKQFDGPDVWNLEALEKTLADLPERQSQKELDAELDRMSEALGGGGEVVGNTALEALAELDAATQLLSSVLRNSELVDDVELKRELLKLAVEGSVLVMGAMLAEDVHGESIRTMIVEASGQALENAEHADALTRLVLLILVVISAGIAANRLGGANLAATLEACFGDQDFTESDTAFALAVWIQAHLGRPEWPARLDALLMRLSPRSFLHNATVAIAVSAYRALADDRLAEKLRSVLSERLTPPVQGGGAAAMQRAANKEQIAKSLLQSRRKYQGIEAAGDDLGVPVLGPAE
jgi:predicted MPP superfamily phosphohydrolase